MNSGMLYYKKKCSRCPREEDIAISIEEAVAKAKAPSTTKPPKVVILVDGQELARHDTLCEVCDEIVSKDIQALARPIEKVSSIPVRTKGKKDSNKPA